MRIYDITTAIGPDMAVYKNKPEKRPVFTVTSDFQTGSSHETRIQMDVHTGTHIDAPLHMIEGGETTDILNLESLVRDCVVIDLTHLNTAAIQAQDLAGADISTDDFILLKTRNSFSDTFDFEFVYVTEDAARWLADKGVAGVGVDALGIERSQPTHPTHKILFNHGVRIIEGLRLADVPAGRYQMVAAPLKLVGVDAAPARVFLIEA